MTLIAADDIRSSIKPRITIWNMV